MMKYHDRFDLEKLAMLTHSLAVSRDQIVKQVGSEPRLSLLESVMEEPEVWDLMLVSVLCLESKPSGSYRALDAEGKLQEIKEFISRSHVEETPGFSEIAEKIEISTKLDFDASSPRLLQLLGDASAEDFGASMKALYCFQRYPKGGPEFLKCIRRGLASSSNDESAHE